MSQRPLDREPLWVGEQVVRAVHQRQLAEHGGGDGVRDESLLASALNRPKSQFDYGNPKPNLAALAEVYAHEICLHRPFISGNKRTALVVSQLFLRLNGSVLHASAAEKYSSFTNYSADLNSDSSPTETDLRARLITEDYRGIFPAYEAFYISSLQYSIERALDAFERYDLAVKTKGSAEVIVGLIQEALMHCASTSRFFWPSKRKGKSPLVKLHAKRAEKLRSAFSNLDLAALSDRSLRDVFEHYDERLDKFLLEDRAGYFFPDPQLGNQSLNDDLTGNVFKLVDTDQNICILLGQKYRFGLLRTLMECLQNQLASMLQTRRLQPFL